MIRVKIKEVLASCEVRLPPTAVVMEEKDVNDEEEEEEMLAHITSISTQPYRLSRARCQRDLRYNKMTLATKFMRPNVRMAV
jgi:hypothetical protein